MATNNDGDTWVCPECGRELEHDKGAGPMPPFLYCPTCRDVAYEARTGTKIGRVRPCPELIAREVQSLCRLNMKVCVESETNEICPEHMAAEAEMDIEEEIWHAR